MKILAALLALCLAMPSLACTIQRTTDGKIARDRAVTIAFQRLRPCPANGRKTGACGGYIKDHRQALCMCGRDEKANLRWQTVSEARKKDKWECKTGWQAKLAACEKNGCFVN